MREETMVQLGVSGNSCIKQNFKFLVFYSNVIKNGEAMQNAVCGMAVKILWPFLWTKIVTYSPITRQNYKS